MKKQAVIIAVTFVLASLATYLVMNFVVLPRQVQAAVDNIRTELKAIPLLSEFEAENVVRAHVVGGPRTGWNRIYVPEGMTVFRRYERGKWMVTFNGYTFVVDDKTGKVTGP